MPNLPTLPVTAAIAPAAAKATQRNAAPAFNLDALLGTAPSTPTPSTGALPILGALPGIVATGPIIAGLPAATIVPVAQSGPTPSTMTSLPAASANAAPAAGTSHRAMKSNGADKATARPLAGEPVLPDAPAVPNLVDLPQPTIPKATSISTGNAIAGGHPAIVAAGGPADVAPTLGPVPPPVVPAIPAPQSGVVRQLGSLAANPFDDALAALPKAASAAASSPGVPIDFIPAVPRAAPAASPLASAGAPAVTPAAQMAPVLVHIARSSGMQHVTIQLSPDELGHVQVHIDRASDGSAVVQVTAERPETLKLLIQDQAQLHRALDDAGVPQDGRSLSLTLGPPSQTPSGASLGGGGDAGRQADSGPMGQGSPHGQPDRRAGQTSSLTAARAAWQRAGIDITA